MLAHILLVGKVLGVVLKQSGIRLRLWFSSFLHRLTYKPGPEPKNIVIVGASFAGYHAARCLVNAVPSGYRVVVIEKNSHFQLTWVLPRFCVVDGHDYKAFIPYGPYLKAPSGSYRWIQDTVESIRPNSTPRGQGTVQVASGESIDYEYLVWTTGSSAALPSRLSHADKDEASRGLQDQRQQLQKARDIVVVGGGPAGVELAADAKAQYPEKNVTLIHSRKALLYDGYGIKLHRAIHKAMEELGVHLVLGERPVIPDGVTGDITLSDGSIHFDHMVSFLLLSFSPRALYTYSEGQIKCTGQKPRSELLRFLSPTTFSASGHIRVKPSLQVADDAFDRIYAAGDVIWTEHLKNARSAMQQAQIVADNICRAIRGGQQIEYQQQWWEGTTKVTLGLGGSAVFMTDGEAEWLVSMKQKTDLDSWMVWKALGAKPFKDNVTSFEKD
ncbi:uncharacterized protein N7459_003728 [Penicillium hispanicum]|uniref:uncharacterized protein n=1 Tax=Penicillium hispanicum TaxID=1080232 RepID=UPI00253F69F1|nr:uncharacterized protein N7459_003728 [Penicillium hispanicum]KAJ5587963.1 hypothetical protein N7459_003728 [Penicillium hispanicum]